MREKLKLILILTALVCTLAYSLLIGPNVFATAFPITPPITPPVTSPTIPPVTPPTVPPVTPPNPVPSKNYIPVIVTQRLANGQVGKRYNVDIIGYDRNLNDKLSMNVYNLPSTFQVKSCQSFIDNSKKYQKCTYAGVPKISGKYLVSIVLSDNNKGTTSKSIILSIGR